MKQHVQELSYKSVGDITIAKQLAGTLKALIAEGKKIVNFTLVPTKLHPFKTEVTTEEADAVIVFETPE